MGSTDSSLRRTGRATRRGRRRSGSGQAEETGGGSTTGCRGEGSSCRWCSSHQGTSPNWRDAASQSGRAGRGGRREGRESRGSPVPVPARGATCPPRCTIGMRLQQSRICGMRCWSSCPLVNWRMKGAGSRKGYMVLTYRVTDYQIMVHMDVHRSWTPPPLPPFPAPA
jgi:hypothetical protein